MCGAFAYVYVGEVRYQLMGSGIERTGLEEVIARRSDLAARYNIRPTQDLVAIVNEDGRPVARPMRWGLIPSWAKADKLPRSTFNARSDKLASSGMWRRPFSSTRAVVPASGFYEWKTENGEKKPQYIKPKSGEIFRFAAIYDHWINEHGETVESCAIVTTEANGFMSDIHDRMPAILDEETIALWLDPQSSNPDTLSSILLPAEDDLLEAHEVSTRVNGYRNDESSLIEPIDDQNDQPTQLSF
jgi:putative SOS response-associated peptidase YedK